MATSGVASAAAAAAAVPSVPPYRCSHVYLDFYTDIEPSRVERRMGSRPPRADRVVVERELSVLLHGREVHHRAHEVHEALRAVGDEPQLPLLARPWKNVGAIART